MKFSMNGFRRQLHHDVCELKDICTDILTDEFFDKDELAEMVNRLITHSNVINCAFNPDDPYFTEIDLELEHFDTKET